MRKYKLWVSNLSSHEFIRCEYVEALTMCEAFTQVRAKLDPTEVCNMAQPV